MKALFASILLLTVLFTNAQICRTIPPATTTLNVQSYNVNDWNNGVGTYADKSITYFIGTGVVPNNSVFNNINTYVCYGAPMAISGVINMQGHNKIFIPVGQIVNATSLSMNGGDTIWVSGTLTLASAMANNSTINNRATIVMNPGASVLIGSYTLFPTQLFQTGGNDSNNILITTGCSSALPSRIVDIRVKVIN